MRLDMRHCLDFVVDGYGVLDSDLNRVGKVQRFAMLVTRFFLL